MSDAHQTPPAASGASAPSHRRRITTAIRRAAIAGLVLSLVIHLGLAVAAWFIRVNRDIGDAGGAAEPVVELAIMSEVELAALAPAEASLALEELTPEELSEIEPPDPSLVEQPLAEIGEPMDGVREIEIDVGGGDVGDIDQSDQPAGAGGLSGASFFGVEAQGTRFAYIVDVSSSMYTQRPNERMPRIERLKLELNRSIQALQDVAEYAVILYADDARPLRAPLSWTQATDRGRRQGARDIETLDRVRGGGTYAMPGFSMVFSLREKPDAIYFMTDGELMDDDPLAAIQTLNRRHRIPIHTILFGDVSPSVRQREGARSLLQQIAARSGGRFVHIGAGP